MNMNTIASVRVLCLVLTGTALAARAEISDKTGLLCQYFLGGDGTTTELPDLSGNGHTATVNGNAATVTKTNVKAMSGFLSATDNVCVPNIVADWAKAWTFVAWVRNPNLTTTKNHLIVRGGTSENAAISAWQAWITPEGGLGLGFVDKGEQVASNVNAEQGRPAALTWEKDVWYQVAITFQYTKLSGDRRGKTMTAYVTKAGSSSLGEPVATLELVNYNGMGNKAFNLVLGGGYEGWYKVGNPGGSLDGEMSEVSFYYERNLTTAELLEDVQSYCPQYYEMTEYATIHWNLDEKGPTPTAADATGHDFDGTTSGSVVGGYAAPTGTCYGGFLDVGSDLFVTLDKKTYFQGGDYNEILLWVKRPVATANSTALLAGNMSQHSDAGAAQPWRVYVTEDGAVGVSMQSWNGYVTKSVGEPYEWGKKWNLVSIRFDRPKLSGGSATYNRIRVHAAPMAKPGEEEDFVLLCEGALERDNSALEGGGVLVFGAVGSGYYDQFQPKSVLGSAGRIGEISVVMDGQFEFDYLKSLLSCYYEDSRGMLMLLR